MYCIKLQISCVELRITNFNKGYFLDLVTVLLVFFRALLFRDVCASQALLEITYWLKALGFALIADFPRLLLTILGVAIFLSFLRTSLHFQFADLFGFKVTILLLDWEWMGIRKFLTIPVDISLAHFDLDLSWDVVTVLFRSSCAHKRQVRHSHHFWST